MPPIRIAIVGAGPVGLTLARLLLDQTNIEVIIFESDKSRHARRQGGTLDLHPDTGLGALQAAGLYAEFLRRARFDGEAFKICDKKLTKYLSLGGVEENSSRGRPEIDRSSLRAMLLDSVPEEMIRWGCHLRSIDDKHNLIFDHGIESGFDLVIGADGAWSKTRQLVSEQKPMYGGVAGFSWTIPNAKETAPECYELTNRGSMFAYGDGKTIMSQQLGDGSLTVHTWSVRPEDWLEKISYDIQDATAVREALLEEFKSWHPQLLDIVHHAQDPIARSLYMLPVGWKWTNRPGVTLVGDAAHVMTPFAGEGVNLGLQDALKLAQAIIKASKSPSPDTSLPAEVEAYEADMYVRAKKTAEVTLDMLNWMFFSEGSPRSVIEKICVRMVSFDMNPVLLWITYPLLTAAVYVLRVQTVSLIPHGL